MCVCIEWVWAWVWLGEAESEHGRPRHQANPPPLLPFYPVLGPRRWDRRPGRREYEGVSSYGTRIGARPKSPF